MTDEMYVPRWPIEHTLPNNRFVSRLYGFRMPWGSERCQQCDAALRQGELCMGCNYYDEEVGYYLCGRCAEPILAPHRVRRRQRDGLLAVDQLQLRVVAERCSPELREPHGVLLAPHSDNGMPRPRTASQTRDVDVVLDAGGPVVVSRVLVHNWYAGLYPARVEVDVFGDDGPHPVGAGRLRKASEWMAVDCSAQWPTTPSGARRAFQHIRLRFTEILEPSAYDYMGLGVILLE